MNWDRPVVGVVRVETSLLAALRDLYGDRLKECYWHNDIFIERKPTKSNDLVGDSSGRGAAPAQSDDKQVRPKSKSRIDKFLSLLRQSNAPLSHVEESETSATVASPPSEPFVAGDILISVGLDWNHPYYRSFLALRKKKGIRIITCCYDLIPVLYPQYCAGDVANYYKQYFLDMAWGSDAVLCISRQSERDLGRVLEEMGATCPKTFVIRLGDDVPVSSGHISEQIAEIAKVPFLLFVSTIERRKNHAALYRAYHLLCESGRRDRLPKLVFVGMPGWGTADLLRDIEADPLTEGLIVQFNNVNDAELRLLYEAALFCLFPSFYEGWGLPVGEALALGKAVLCSDRGSLPEVGGDLVLYTDPWIPSAWAKEIWNLLSDRKKLSEMESRVRRQFKAQPWSNAATTVRSVIDNLLDLPREIEISPGYAMSTESGEQMGALIRSTEAKGYLMFGPHWSLNAGSYRITIWDVCKDREAGLAIVDLVSNFGQEIHWKHSVDIRESGGSDPLLDFYVMLNKPVNNFEVRCLLERGALTLSRMRIREITKQHEIQIP